MKRRGFKKDNEENLCEPICKVTIEEIEPARARRDVLMLARKFDRIEYCSNSINDVIGKIRRYAGLK